MLRLSLAVTATLFATLLPFPSSSQQLECPNYWRNPETGELECLNLGSGGRSQPDSTSETDISSFGQYLANFRTCTPSSSVLPFLEGIVNRAHIKGWVEQRCEVEYTFAPAEQPEQEATYLLCRFRPETLAQIASEGAVVLEEGEECQSFDWFLE